MGFMIFPRRCQCLAQAYEPVGLKQLLLISAKKKIGRSDSPTDNAGYHRVRRILAGRFDSIFLRLGLPMMSLQFFIFSTQ